MPTWLVPVRIVERKRLATVIADTAAEARVKARGAEWVRVGDCAQHDVTVVGAAEKISEEDLDDYD